MVPSVQAGLTVAQAMQYWLQDRESEVRRTTLRGYKQASSYIVGPLLLGNRVDRHQFTRRGRKKPDAQFIPMLGPIEIEQLTTAQIRAWHRLITSYVGAYTARVAKKFLRAALCLAAEDFGVRVPPMPTRLGRGRPSSKKHILTPQQVGMLINAAQGDKSRGLYYAFPFLTGVRPSEQLALSWEDVDFGARVIRIRRSQEPDGLIAQLTKTAASRRDIPMSSLLFSMITDWQMNCPKRDTDNPRVFPCLGARRAKQYKTRGRPLTYTNFVNTYWRPALAALGLPRVTPHSARHTFISTLQAQGAEVGLVAQLAGHANPNITLSHYTQAIRGGERAVEALDQAFGLKSE